MQEKSVITRTIETARGVYAPGHLGELTQIVDFALVDAVLEETGTREQRLRLLPSRVVVYFVLALALFEHCSYRAVWGKLTAGLAGLPLVRPAVSSLARARRRIGAAPLRRLFEILAGPVARRGQAGAFYRGLRTVAVDGTLLHVPDEEQAHLALSQAGGRDAGVRLPAAAAAGRWSSAEPGPCSPPPSVRRPMVNSPMPGACCGALDAHDAPAGRCRLRRGRLPATPSTAPAPSSWCAPLPAVSPPRPGICPTAPTSPARLRRAARPAAGPRHRGPGHRHPGRRHRPHRAVASAHQPAGPRPLPRRRAVDLYHERWQAETTYFSIKATLLDGRVLRSRSLDGLDQEVYALLTTYQALIRAAADTAATRPGLDMDRISFTVLLQAAADRSPPPPDILPTTSTDLVGAIGRAVLDALLPAQHRSRVKARTRKNPTSKYGPNAGQHPQTTQNYTVQTHIKFFENGLAPRRHR